MFNLPHNVINALLDLNDVTEHQFGLGPLEDDFQTDRRNLIRKALRSVRRHSPDVADSLSEILLNNH